MIVVLLACGEMRAEMNADPCARVGSRVQARSERRRKNAEALVDDTRRQVYKLLEDKPVHFISNSSIVLSL